MTREHIVKGRTEVDWLYHSDAHSTEKHETNCFKNSDLSF